MEKRKEDRYNTKLIVKLKAGTLRRWGVLKDISSNGLLVKCNHKFHPEIPIDIEVIMPDGETATIKGVVRRVIITPDANMQFGIGIEITEKNMMYRTLLRYTTANKQKTIMSSHVNRNHKNLKIHTS